VTVYDVVLANDEEFFSHRVRELCGANNLSFFLLEPIWLEPFIQKLQQGDIGVGVYIDFGSDPYDPHNIYYRLAKEVKASGGYVIDDPDRSPITTHKGKFHAVLLKNAVPVPETILVPRSDLQAFRLTDQVRQAIGAPFVVKPAWGYGGRGVNTRATTEDDLVRAAQAVPDSDAIMLQRRIVPKTLQGRPAWFRVFSVCGEIIPCWWHPGTGDYRMVSPLERRRYGLVALEQIVHKIAQLSRMEFFSTEIALDLDDKFVVIDYLNDECDMHAKSYWPDGVPDELARRVAHLMVQKAINVIHKHPFENELVERDRRSQGQHGDGTPSGDPG
jgi:hypothetical protein